MKLKEFTVFTWFDNINVLLNLKANNIFFHYSWVSFFALKITAQIEQLVYLFSCDGLQMFSGL